MKQFFIKLISITFAIIIIIKVIFNLIIADHLVGIKRVLSLSDNEVRKDLGDKIIDMPEFGVAEGQRRMKFNTDGVVKDE